MCLGVLCQCVVVAYDRKAKVTQAFVIGSLGYHDNHIVIRWFWAAVERFNNEQRLRLLQVRRHWFIFLMH